MFNAFVHTLPNVVPKHSATSVPLKRLVPFTRNCRCSMVCVHLPSPHGTPSTITPWSGQVTRRIFVQKEDGNVPERYELRSGEGFERYRKSDISFRKGNRLLCCSCEEQSLRCYVVSCFYSLGNKRFRNERACNS